MLYEELIQDLIEYMNNKQSITYQKRLAIIKVYKTRCMQGFIDISVGLFFLSMKSIQEHFVQLLEQEE
jgi:hypothetical protein